MATDATLRAIWFALLDRLGTAVANPTVNAATLNVARDFLRDNGINARTLSEARAGLERLAELSQSFADLPDCSKNPSATT
jgi:hypothetical protein